MDKVPAWFLDLCEGPASKIEGVWVSTHLVSLAVSQEGRRAGRRPPRHERHRPHSTRDAKEGTFEATVRGTRSVTLESVSPGVRFSVEISPSFCGDTPHPTWLPCRSQSGARISWRLYSACFCGVAPRSELSAVSFRQSKVPHHPVRG